MQKKTILVVINNLHLGGAETLLVGILPELNLHYNLVLVTLSEECDFEENKIICQHKYSLGFSNKLSIISCVFRLNKIIQKHKPFVIHAHLVYSSIVARIASARDIPVIYTIHSLLSKSVFNNSSLLTWIEKNTITSNHSLVAVSNEVMKDYTAIIKPGSKSFVLKNYVNDRFFSQQSQPKNYNTLPSIRMVAVGNIKYVKNYQYLIEAFIELKDLDISLDIYGQDQSNMQPAMEKLILAHNLPIQFKGINHRIHEILGNYNLFVMPSRYEGFGIAAVEAMAMGLPLLLSNINVLKEVTFNNGLFFDLNNKQSFIDLIRNIFLKKFDLNSLSVKGIEIAKSNYSQKDHLKQLYSIYESVGEQQQ